MPTCSFCNKEYELPRGLTLVDSISGRILHFCSSKCRRNHELGRDNRKVKWIKKKKKERRIEVEKEKKKEEKQGKREPEEEKIKEKKAEEKRE